MTQLCDQLPMIYFHFNKTKLKVSYKYAYRFFILLDKNNTYIII